MTWPTVLHIAEAIAAYLLVFFPVAVWLGRSFKRQRQTQTVTLDELFEDADLRHDYHPEYTVDFWRSLQDQNTLSRLGSRVMLRQAREPDLHPTEAP